MNGMGAAGMVWMVWHGYMIGLLVCYVYVLMCCYLIHVYYRYVVGVGMLHDVVYVYMGIRFVWY